MKSKLVNLSILIILSSIFLFTPQISPANTEDIEGCRKPTSGWLYPENQFNLSGVVTIHWAEALVERGEIIVYRLYFNSTNAESILISKALFNPSYNLNTVLLPQGEGKLILDSFDGYTSTVTSVRVNINQSISTTPIDPSVLEDPACILETPGETITSSQQTSMDWFAPILGLFLGVPLIYTRFSVKKRRFE